MRWLVGLALLGCGRMDFDPLIDAASGSKPDDPNADGATACAFGPWSLPQRLDAIDTFYNEWSAALSTDRLTLLFESDRAGGRDLYQATRTSTTAPFGSGVALPAINTIYSERDPTLSHDGLTLYFTSDRTGAPLLYRATRASTSSSFAAPMTVPELTGVTVTGPALSMTGGELFYSDSGESQVRRATYSTATGFVPAGPVTALQTGFASAAPSLSGDGLAIYYHHKRDVFVPYDLHVARRAAVGAPFDPPTPIAEFNLVNSDDGHPEISKDGRTLVFASTRPGVEGGADLYLADRDCQ